MKHFQNNPLGDREEDGYTLHLRKYQNHRVPPQEEIDGGNIGSVGMRSLRCRSDFSIEETTVREEE